MDVRLGRFHFKTIPEAEKFSKTYKENPFVMDSAIKEAESYGFSTGVFVGIGCALVEILLCAILAKRK